MLKKLIKNNKFLSILILIILTVPSFFRMLSFGMFSTADFHLFRLHQFDLCVKNLEIPCRWSPDAGLGYGEPVFNFYGQFAYIPGEILHLIGFSLIDSLKASFILSLIIGAIGMYLLSKKIWKSELGGMLSALIYTYAPYRAVDIWVRGALPEAMAFAVFPFILLGIEQKSVKLFTLASTLLLLTHNLSFVMFMPVIVAFIVLRRFWAGFTGLAGSAVLSAFYILPVVFESKFVDLESTTRGYFDYHNHYATLSELFIKNFWGYGASVWGPNDDLSLSVGYLQWILPLFVFAFLGIKKHLKKYPEFMLLFIMFWMFLFLTHNKSTSIWESLNFMKYIQFPWRFLSVIVFLSALSSGLIMQLSGKIRLYLLVIAGTLLLILNVPFFRPDVWYPVGDEYYLTEPEWNRQRAASIGDFWPKNGFPIPANPNQSGLINYFPGWEHNGEIENGLIQKEGAVFKDTPVRMIGNLISLTGILTAIFYLSKKKE